MYKIRALLHEIGSNYKVHMKFSLQKDILYIFVMFDWIPWRISWKFHAREFLLSLWYYEHLSYW